MGILIFQREGKMGFYTKRLGSEIKIRHVPELRFFHDQSSEKAHEVLIN